MSKSSFPKTAPVLKAPSRWTPPPRSARKKESPRHRIEPTSLRRPRSAQSVKAIPGSLDRVIVQSNLVKNPFRGSGRGPSSVRIGRRCAFISFPPPRSWPTTLTCSQASGQSRRSTTKARNTHNRSRSSRTSLISRLPVRTTHNYHEPSADADLKLYQVPERRDVLVSYNEVNDKSDSIQRRAYFLYVNIERIKKNHKPRFVNPQKFNDAVPIPVEQTVSEASSTNTHAPVYATTEATLKSFTLHTDRVR